MKDDNPFARAKPLWDQAMIISRAGDAKGRADLPRAIEMMREVVAIYGDAPRGGSDAHVARRHLARMLERQAEQEARDAQDEEPDALSRLTLRMLPSEDCE